MAKHQYNGKHNSRQQRTNSKLHKGMKRFSRRFYNKIWAKLERELNCK